MANIIQSYSLVISELQEDSDVIIHNSKNLKEVQHNHFDDLQNMIYDKLLTAHKNEI
jgi:hypothetical protein